MLKYLILSTPRCGSSALMECADICLGEGTFVREPLNPYEDRKFHPSVLHAASVEERAAILCDPSSSIIGMKHVYSPFNQSMSSQSDWDALGRVLSTPGLRVILLSRKKLRHQFVSMEIAIQSGDWWSSGPDALPDSLDVVRAGRAKPIDDLAISGYLHDLGEANVRLREACRAAGANFTEYAYETLFEATPDAALCNICAALSQFGVKPVGKAKARRMLNLIGKGQRFQEISSIREHLEKAYPSLRDR